MFFFHFAKVFKLASACSALLSWAQVCRSLPDHVSSTWGPEGYSGTLSISSQRPKHQKQYKLKLGPSKNLGRSTPVKKWGLQHTLPNIDMEIKNMLTKPIR